MENILTKELAWFYRVVIIKEDDETVELLVDQTKYEEQLNIELEVVFGKKVLFKKGSPSEVDKILTQVYRTTGKSDKDMS